MVFVPALWDSAEWDVSRWDVTKPLRLPNLSTVTRLIRVESSVSGQTGKPIVTYTEEDAEVAARYLTPKELELLPAGAVPMNYLILIAQDGFLPLDRTRVNNVLFEVQNIGETWDGDSFAYRTVLVKKVVT